MAAVDETRTLKFPYVDQNGQPTMEPRRVHGLRFPVLPTGSLLAQVGGGIALLSGVFMEFGGAAALMVGGAAAVVLGMLREDNKV